jgi:hypothetical protein
VVDEADGYPFCIADDGLMFLDDRLAKIIDRDLSLDRRARSVKSPPPLAPRQSPPVRPRG